MRRVSFIYPEVSSSAFSLPLNYPDVDGLIALFPKSPKRIREFKKYSRINQFFQFGFGASVGHCKPKNHLIVRRRYL